jgi:hypothetical protein
MIDLKSLCISGTVFNLGSKALQFLSQSLSGVLKSGRVIFAGVEASSCDHIARTEHVLSMLQSDDVRRSDFNAGFGLKTETANDIHGKFVAEPIQPGANRNATWKPRSTCESFFPLSMVAGSLQIELTFSDDPKSGLDTSGEADGSLFNVSELVCHVDVLSMDPSFLSNLSSHLVAGHSLQLQYQNTQPSFYSILSAASQISHARSASRLNQVMLTFGEADDSAGATKSQTQLLYPAGNTLEARLTIGEKRMPATEDLTGAAMLYHKLMQGLGNRAPSISREAYMSNSFIVAFDLEAAPNVQCSTVAYRP